MQRRTGALGSVTHEAHNPSLDAMAAEPLDVLVVGGGIVGAGVARDAAVRGLRTGLVEQYDFAWGTSSRSSRLLHGGIRYLAQGRLRLVREASVEKRRVHEIAPHLAEPLPFLFPTYRGTAWPLWQLRIGVKLYDLLCGGHGFGRSTSMDALALRERLPAVNGDGLTGAVRYFDGLTSDSRLVIDSLRSAAGHGALLRNYCRLDAAEAADHCWACHLRDRLADREQTVLARCVVNATGPWAQQFAQSQVRLRPTKGVHLVVDRGRLPLDDAVVMTDRRRVLFAIPWGARLILGTTDTDYQGRIEDAHTEPDDVAYVLAMANALFPDAALTEADVKATWAGLRPLVSDERGKPSDISRRHKILAGEPGWWDIAGGKLTTYRQMGEEMVDRIAKYLRRKTRACRTADEPLLRPEQADGVSSLLPPDVSRKAVEHYCRAEWAVHLDDVMVRRTSWAAYLPEPDLTAERVATWMAETLGWDDARRAEELEAYRALPG